MRTRLLSAVLALMFVGLLMPSASLAKRVTAAGSLSFTRGNGTPLDTELVVTTVMANPGLEKTVAQRLIHMAGAPRLTRRSSSLVALGPHRVEPRLSASDPED